MDDEESPRLSGGRSDRGAAQSLQHDPRVSMWLADDLQAETARTLVRMQSLADMQRMAVMPDVHPSRSVCVGCVLGTLEVVYPEAIGGDIGCGMSAVRVQGIDAGHFTPSASRQALMGLGRRVAVMVRPPRVEVPDEGPDGADLRDAGLRRLAARLGPTQMGTLGRGNHFVEVQADESGEVWVMVHSGSRGMGQAVAAVYGRVAQKEGVRSVLPGLRMGTAAGQGYLADQEWCVRYAAANRWGLLHAAVAGLRAGVGGRADWGTLIDAPHNFVRVERHGEVEYLVHRKGAAPAPAGALGLIPGSAGTFSVHVEGRGEARAMCSSSHGAGRVLSRGDAKRTLTLGDLRRQMGGVAYDEARAHSLRDEAPGAYRDLRVVLRAQRELVRVVRTLRPLVSFKAGG